VRCPRCQFENIPGETRCLRCSSVLEAKDAAVDINPPRMARWKKPVRAVLKWSRLHSIWPERRLFGPKSRAFLKMMPVKGLLGIVLSIIPGLAHLVDGRFREVRWWVLGWFLTLLAGLFFYGGDWGFLLLGLAIGIHGWIAFSHTLLAQEEDFNKRLFDYAALLMILGLIYWGVRATAFHDFAFGYSNFTIPDDDVNVGDTLLLRYSRAVGVVLPRGSIVLGNFHGLYGNHVTHDNYEITGQVIALPGEKVEIVEGRFVINGEALDVNRFPVPAWLSRGGLSAIIPADSYFVSTVYHIDVHGHIQLTSTMICDVCILRAGDIEARAVMRWFPLARRGFLRTDE